MNTMLVSVTERTREIGLRLAMGAVLAFLIEAMLLCALRCVVGVVLATGASSGPAQLVGVPCSFDLVSNVLALLFSLSIGVLFG